MSTIADRLSIVADMSGAQLDAAVAKAAGIQWQIRDDGKVYGWGNPCGFPGACPGWHQMDSVLCYVMNLRTAEQRRAFVVEKLGALVDLS